MAKDTNNMIAAAAAAAAAKEASEFVKHTAEITAAALSKFNSENATLNANIEYIKKDLSELKQDFKESKLKYIDVEQHKEVVGTIADHETRIRVNEVNLTQVKTWGAAGIILIGIIEFLLNRFMN